MCECARVMLLSFASGGRCADFFGSGGRLKLKLYRSLGVDIEAGEGKAMVWNAGRGTAEVVSLATDQKQAQQSCADRIWAAL